MITTVAEKSPAANGKEKRRNEMVPFEEYALEIKKGGKRIVPGSGGTYWVEYEKFAMMRIPTFSLDAPAPDEILTVFRKGRALVASYIVEPDGSHPANAWLYVSPDTSYSLDKLKPAGRRDVHRGLRELKIRPVTPEELIAYGVQAFCDTRSRNGLSDGTPEEFAKRFLSRVSVSCHNFLGAWKDDTLAAFLSITEFADWAEIDGSFSMNAFLRLCPNDSLIYSALHYYLIEKRCRLVSYGLSSLQTESKEIGLHTFKLKVGFEAKPVRRVFALYPLTKPFANKLTLRVIRTALHFRSRSRVLKKACGALEVILDKRKSYASMESAKGKG